MTNILIRKGILDTDMHREKMMGRHRKKTAVYEQRRGLRTNQPC